MLKHGDSRGLFRSPFSPCLSVVSIFFLFLIFNLFYVEIFLFLCYSILA
ncbi:hypothetical protein BREVNS_0677 [Brevinematales bacterium NS]|nr:hypothetical protein BREVNS_0677 [Brevinematales bacterium NS]